MIELFKSDYEAVRRRLEGLSNEQFRALLGDVFGTDVEEADVPPSEVLRQDGSKRALRNDWRKQLTEEMLDSKTDNPAAWNGLCLYLGIKTNEASTLWQNWIKAACGVLVAIAALISGTCALMRQYGPEP